MIRRAAAFVGRRPFAALVTAGGLGIWTTIAVNALVFQDGPHPAPLLGESRPSQPSVAMLPRPRPQAKRRASRPQASRTPPVAVNSNPSLSSSATCSARSSSVTSTMDPWMGCADR